jgi:hypothetical protein
VWSPKGDLVELRLGSLVLVGGLALSGACSARGRVVQREPRLDPQARFAGFTETCDGIPGALPEHYVSRDYGPLTPAQKRGMCTWYLWPGGDALSRKGADAEGNPRFWRRVEALTSRIAHGTGLAVNLTWLGFLDSRRRDSRFKTTGVINDPDCAKAGKVDAFGLWIDQCKDPYSSGVLGIRLYPNHRFDPARWDPARFFADGSIEPPYLAGLTCGICHIALNPLRPPADPEHPEWKNIVGALGNQYLREGQVFKGRLPPDNFLYQVYEAQQAGTSDTSRLSTDFINNPNAINGIFFLASHRPRHPQLMSDGRTREVPNVLKDGADSIGAIEAALRVYVNIGSCGDYRMSLEQTLVGLAPQRPFDLTHAGAACEDWRLTAARMTDVAAFLDAPANASYRLADAPGAHGGASASAEELEIGQRAFAENCARCHSSKLPPGLTEESRHDPSAGAAWTALVRRDDFLEGNYLSDDRRYPIVSSNKRFEIGTNAARAVATNAVEGHLWQNFSSRTYKMLPSPGTLNLYNPFDPSSPIEFTLPASRGYYRTPSLIAIWTSAPFLHNNSLGRYDGDPSVEGRLRAFRDAAGKLLWPERRDGVKSIKVTTGPTFLQVRDVRVEVPSGTPVNLLAHIDQESRQVVAGLRAELRHTLGDPARLAQVARALGDPAERTAELKRVARELLEYNQCPDFIEDRGHLFGGGLSDAEKAALISYMETF